MVVKWLSAPRSRESEDSHRAVRACVCVRAHNNGQPDRKYLTCRVCHLSAALLAHSLHCWQWTSFSPPPDQKKCGLRNTDRQKLASQKPVWSSVFCWNCVKAGYTCFAADNNQKIFKNKIIKKRLKTSLLGTVTVKGRRDFLLTSWKTAPLVYCQIPEDMSKD